MNIKCELRVRSLPFCKIRLTAPKPQCAGLAHSSERSSQPSLRKRIDEYKASKAKPLVPLPSISLPVNAKPCHYHCKDACIFNWLLLYCVMVVVRPRVTMDRRANIMVREQASITQFRSSTTLFSA